MTRYELFLSVAMIGFEALLCILVYARGVQKLLPWFAGFVSVSLGACVGQLLIFAHFGFESATSFYFGWISYGIVLLVRSAAIAELCRDCLRAYPGIWGLTWRLVCLMSLLLVIHAAIDAQGQPNWFTAYGLTIERDIDIASFCILAAMLGVAVYYRLHIETLQLWIAVGICFYCLVTFADNTVVRDLFVQYRPVWATMKSQMQRVNDARSTIIIAASCITIGSWSFVLRKPLPVPAKAPELLPVEVYQELSPAINLRLRELNERLLEMLKP